MATSFKNLPYEMLEQARFFAVGANKHPIISGWNKPENQKKYVEFGGFVGFDVVGHGSGADYAFLDFDHVLNGDKFVNETAEDFVNALQLTFPNIYIEKSISGTGLHAFLKPTAGKFQALTPARLYFGNSTEKDSPKLEIFYRTEGRFCLMTGVKYDDGVEIPFGESADKFLEGVLADISKQASLHGKISDKKEISAPRNVSEYNDPPEYTKDLAIELADRLNFADLERDEWLPCISALKNSGFSKEELREKCQHSPRYDEKNFDKEFDSLTDPNFGIETLIGKARDFDIKAFKKKWYENHPQFAHREKRKTVDNLDSLNVELCKINEKIAGFDTEKKSAIEKLKNQVTFDKGAAFSDEIINAAAFAYIYDKGVFSDFKKSIQNQNKKENFIQDWRSAVKDKADEIQTQIRDLKSRQNKILAKIDSTNFFAQNDELKKFAVPEGYSVTIDGIEKIVGEKSITVSRSPIFIFSVFCNVDDETFQFVLSYLNARGKWRNLPPQKASVIFNTKKIVDLADFGLPVASTNAFLLVEYLIEFRARNEVKFTHFFNIPCCGWREVCGKEFFIDPRRNCEFSDGKRQIKMVVDPSNTFAQFLKSAGTLEEWRRAYEIAKKSHIARLIVAASIAPPLLKILDGERNFILYIYGTTRAGKSTALLLGASAVGNEDLVISFDGTNNGLLGMAAETCDYPLFIDEKQTADKNLKEQFQRFIYSVGNGKGRSRANKDGSARPVRKWRNITIGNGETPLLDGNATGGAYTRLLQVHVPNEILPADDCREIRKIIKDNYGVIFPLIVDEILKEDKTELKDCFKKRANALQERYPNVLPEYCRYAALLSIADALLNKLLGVEHTTAWVNSYATATDFIGLFVPTIDEISDARREKNFVESFVAQNQAHFEDSRSIKINGVTEYLSPTPPYFGKFADDGFIYIIDSVLQKACKDSGFDYKKVSADLIADGFFIPADKIEKDRKKPRDTVRFRIGASRPYCYRFKQVEEQQTDD